MGCSGRGREKKEEEEKELHLKIFCFKLYLMHLEGHSVEGGREILHFFDFF